MFEKLGASDIVALLRPQYVFAVCLAAGVLLFLPESVVGLPETIRPWLAIAFAVSAALLASQGAAALIQRRAEDRKAKAAIAKADQEARLAEERAENEAKRKIDSRLATLDNLTPEEKEILAWYVASDSKTKELDINSGVVTGLMRKGVLYQASSIVHKNIYVSFTAWFGQVNMNDWAWDHLMANLHLLES